MKFIDRIRVLLRCAPRTVVFDDEQVIRTMANGKTESVRWDELQSVAIVTTGDGPWAEDVFWVLKGKTGGCAVPQGVQGSTELLKRLQELPGFRNEALIEAMGSTSNARFICWERSSEQSPELHAS